MKYLCLSYLARQKWSACPDAVCFEAAQGLHPVETATTLWVRIGQRS